jgi:hypothetical protein
MSSSRMARVVIAVVFAVTALTGCGKHYWGQAGATQEQFDRDSRECAKEAAPSPSAAQYGIVYEGYYRACLSARGWKREQHMDPRPDGIEDWSRTSGRYPDRRCRGRSALRVVRAGHTCDRARWDRLDDERPGQDCTGALEVLGLGARSPQPWISASGGRRSRPRT